MVADNNTQWLTVSDSLGKTIARHFASYPLLAALEANGPNPNSYDNLARILSKHKGLHGVASAIFGAAGDRVQSVVCEEMKRLNREDVRANIIVVADSTLDLGKKSNKSFHTPNDEFAHFCATNGFRLEPLIIKKGAKTNELAQAIILKISGMCEYQFERTQEYLMEPLKLPIFFGKIIVFCMFNDLCISKAERRTLVPGEILTEKQKRDMLYLSHTLSRLPNAIFIGPGSAKAWNTRPEFDEGANEMLKYLDGFGVMHVNMLDQIYSMQKRDNFHFANLPENKVLFTRVLHVAINIMENTFMFGFSRYITEMATENEELGIFLRERTTVPSQELQHNINNEAWRNSFRKDQHQVYNEQAIMQGSVTRMVVARTQDLQGSGRPLASLASSTPTTPAEQTRPVLSIPLENGLWYTLVNKTGILETQNSEFQNMHKISKAMARKLRHSRDISKTADARINHDFLMAYLKAEFIKWSQKQIFDDPVLFMEMLASVQDPQKPRFQFFLRLGSGRPLAWRAIQGHSTSLAPVENMGWRQIDSSISQYLWHGTFRRYIDPIQRKGLIPGGGKMGGRIELYFSARHPHGGLDPNDPIPVYKFDCEIYFVIDLTKAINQGNTFYLTSSGAVVCRGSVHQSCLINAIDHHNNVVWMTKLPEPTSWKSRQSDDAKPPRVFLPTATFLRDSDDEEPVTGGASGSGRPPALISTRSNVTMITISDTDASNGTINNDLTDNSAEDIITDTHREQAIPEPAAYNEEEPDWGEGPDSDDEHIQLLSSGGKEEDENTAFWSRVTEDDWNYMLSVWQGDLSKDHQRCVKCGYIVTSGDHFCRFCSAPQIDHPTLSIANQQAATEGCRTYGLVFHWVLRGFSQNDAKAARKYLKRATGMGFTSIYDRFLNDLEFRTSMIELNKWNADTAREQDDLAAQPAMEAPRSRAERESMGLWRQVGFVGGGHNTTSRGYNQSRHWTEYERSRESRSYTQAEWDEWNSRHSHWRY